MDVVAISDHADAFFIDAIIDEILCFGEGGGLILGLASPFVAAPWTDKVFLGLVSGLGSFEALSLRPVPSLPVSSLDFESLRFGSFFLLNKEAALDVGDLRGLGGSSSFLSASGGECFPFFTGIVNFILMLVSING